MDMERIVIHPNKWIKENCPSLHHLEMEMNEYQVTCENKPAIEGVTYIAASDGYTTVVTTRFAMWFLDRNKDWKAV